MIPGREATAGGQEFPPASRLRTSRDYTRTWRQGRRYHTAQLVVVAAIGFSGVRLGITVSRKVGGAVDRNRLKRWIREYFRRHRGKLVSPLDLSVVAKPGAASLEHGQLDDQLRDAFTRLQLYAAP